VQDSEDMNRLLSDHIERPIGEPRKSDAPQISKDLGMHKRRSPDSFHGMIELIEEVVP
jgi:hypothetical protein